MARKRMPPTSPWASGRAEAQRCAYKVDVAQSRQQCPTALQGWLPSCPANQAAQLNHNQTAQPIELKFSKRLKGLMSVQGDIFIDRPQRHSIPLATSKSQLAEKARCMSLPFQCTFRAKMPGSRLGFLLSWVRRGFGGGRGVCCFAARCRSRARGRVAVGRRRRRGLGTGSDGRVRRVQARGADAGHEALVVELPPARHDHSVAHVACEVESGAWYESE
jgi:hypothetical protein